MKLRGKKNKQIKSCYNWTTKFKFVSRGEQLIYVDIKCLRRRDFVKPYDFKKTLVVHIKNLTTE
jgi:hypothetical protein